MLIMIILAFYYRDQPDISMRVENAFSRVFLFAMFPSLISFYLFYFILFPRFLPQKKYALAILFGLLISFGDGIFGYVLLAKQFGAECIDGTESNEDLVGVVLFMSMLALISGIVALVIRGFLTWFEELKLKETLKQKNRDMELALVKSQLDPHFLFNTINNIDVLILKNAEKASDYLNKLSDIMRFMLYETKTDEIPLAKEIEYIEKYIALQKIRTANANYVNFSVTGTANGNTIAPMIFIPFIENTFKHTTNKKFTDAISIKIAIEKQQVKFECINKIDPDRKRKRPNSGLGNNLIQKRLELIYPDKHELKVNHQPDLYSVFLTINNG